MVNKEDVMKALKKVIDPELGINIVDLGLVYAVYIKNDMAEVKMTLTSPGCPIAPQLMSESEAAIMKIKGIKKAKVEFIFDPPWTPKKMSDQARMELGI
ncbi:metal-sulfur cluster assembly factor [archaeon]|nr:metal-sulfur cluster assembly factor [archaeon]MBL7056845.1 metal-sulfur cluster assembly factor [Candidatus Woesearchaeota archaeon]